MGVERLHGRIHFILIFYDGWSRLDLLRRRCLWSPIVQRRRLRARVLDAISLKQGFGDRNLSIREALVVCVAFAPLPWPMLVDKSLQRIDEWCNQIEFARRLLAAFPVGKVDQFEPFDFTDFLPSLCSEFVVFGHTGNDEQCNNLFRVVDLNTMVGVDLP